MLALRAPSTFGGVIPTPALDRIAQTGLRYTRFHTTALCSPTRAALLTGRNHHSVGTGVVVDQATGFPGYNSVIPRDAVAIGEILRQSGYATAWYGKDHNVPQWDASQQARSTNGRPDRSRALIITTASSATTRVSGSPAICSATRLQSNLPRPPRLEPHHRHGRRGDQPPQNAERGAAQPAVDGLLRAGGTHAPHHPTPEWIKKISDMHLFENGWNALRDTIFANQKRLGVIPQDAKLTPWPDSLKKDELDDFEEALHPAG